MSQPIPAQRPDESASEALPSFEPPVPWLAAGMDEEEAALVVGLGLLVREAGAVEYTLHALVVHLNGEKRAYAFQAAEPATGYIKECKKRLNELSGEKPVSTASRVALLHDLDLCAARFAERNRYVHGCWTFDDERQSWLTVKGSKKKDARWPEIDWASSTQLWELAAEFSRLNKKLIAWDAAHYGQLAEDENGEEGWASVKRF